jgi:hypothetical protein
MTSSSPSKIASAFEFNLGQRFINHSVPARELALAYLSGISLLWHGKGGLGKTEMVMVAMDTIQVSKGILECHPSTTVSELFGGATAQTDVKVYPDGSPLYATEITFESIDFDKGFLTKKQFFMEEALDAPIRVLAAAKAALTNKAWGGRESQNHILLGASNIDPYILVEDLPVLWQNSIRAFLERFLVVEHGEGTLQEDDYLGMATLPDRPAPLRLVSENQFDVEIAEVKTVKIPDNVLRMVAQLATKSNKSGSFVSLRTSAWLQKLMRASAYIAGRDEVTLDDLNVIPLVGSFHASISKDLEKEVQLQRQNLEINTKLGQIQNKLEKIQDYFKSGADTPYTRGMTAEANLKTLAGLLQSITVNDSTSSKKEQLQKYILEFAKEARKQAEQSVVVKNLF